jgi:hypothetical protein
MNRIVLPVVLVGLASLAGCAAAPDVAPDASAPAARPAPAPALDPARPAPGMDGGIVGTGNRPDCEPRNAKDGTALPLPQGCPAR